MSGGEVSEGCCAPRDPVGEAFAFGICGRTIGLEALGEILIVLGQTVTTFASVLDAPREPVSINPPSQLSVAASGPLETSLLIGKPFEQNITLMVKVWSNLI